MKYFFLIFISLTVRINVLSQTEEDHKEIVQLCIDLEAFQPYYNLSKGERLPVVILDNGLIPVIDGLEKFKQPVEFWSIEKIFAAKKAHLSFSTFQVTPTKARVIFAYEAEGAHIIMSLAKIEDHWEVIRSSVTER